VDTKGMTRVIPQTAAMIDSPGTPVWPVQTREFRRDRTSRRAIHSTRRDRLDLNNRAARISFPVLRFHITSFGEHARPIHMCRQGLGILPPRRGARKPDDAVLSACRWNRYRRQALTTRWSCVRTRPSRRSVDVEVIVQGPARPSGSWRAASQASRDSPRQALGKDSILGSILPQGIEQRVSMSD